MSLACSGRGNELLELLRLYIIQHRLGLTVLLEADAAMSHVVRTGCDGKVAAFLTCFHVQKKAEKAQLFEF